MNDDKGAIMSHNSNSSNDDKGKVKEHEEQLERLGMGIVESDIGDEAPTPDSEDYEDYDEYGD